MGSRAEPLKGAAGPLPNSELLHARAREAALKRHRKADDPELIAATAERRYVAAEEYVRRLVAEAPTLTEAQRGRIAALLRSGGGLAA
jgi:hypothetical protein